MLNENNHLKKAYIALLVISLVSIPLIFANSSHSASVTSYETEVLELVNKERAKYSLNSLTLDENLMNAADIRASELKKSFSHNRPDGSSFSTVSSKAYGENIAAGYKTPKEVVTGWMNSQGHRENILNPNYDTIGIGYLKSGSSYWVQLFGINKANNNVMTISITTSAVAKPKIAIVGSKKKITVKWNKVSGASGYQVYRYTRNNGKLMLKKTTITKSNVVKLVDGNLSKKKYSYKIRAYKKINNKITYGSFSSTKSTTPK